MEELVFKSAKGTPATNSLLVAQKFGKQHKDVLETIRNLTTAENSAVLSMFYETTYYNEQNKQQPLFVMNRDGFSLLVMGFTGKDALNFKLEFIEAFNKMESILKSGGFQVPQSFSEALQLAARQAEQIESQQKQIELQRPAVVFHESVTASDTVITVGDLAKLICQNGVDTGEKRLYQWLVDNDYLICRKRWSKARNRYENDYMPYQRYIEMDLFFVSETIIQGSDEPFVRHTVKIKGKGQSYFINKFLNKAA